MATSPITFLKETRDELSKVKWPSRAEIIRLTSIVILISLGVGIYLGAVDFILTKALQIIVR